MQFLLCYYLPHTYNEAWNDFFPFFFQVIRTTFASRKSKDSRPDEAEEMETFDHDHELEALQENSRPIIKTKNIDLNQPDEGSLDSSSQIGKLVFWLDG